MNSNLVSIIIPCFNQGHYIKEAVNSALEQTYNNIEIIIVNDGSSDGMTANIIDKIANLNGSNVKVIHTINQGLPLARNTGIEISKGSFIVPLDSDNKLDRFFVEKTMIIFNSNSDVDVVYTNALYFGLKNGLWQQSDISFPQMLKNNLVDACAIFRKKVWELCEGYKKNMLYGWEDWDFWLTAHENSCRFYHLNEPLFYYRIGDSSMRDQIELFKKRKQYLEQQLIKNHTLLFQQYFPEPLTLLRELDILRTEAAQFEQYKKGFYQTASYRIGHFILSPFKLIMRKKK